MAKEQSTRSESDSKGKSFRDKIFPCVLFGGALFGAYMAYMSVPKVQEGKVIYEGQFTARVEDSRTKKERVEPFHIYVIKAKDKSSFFRPFLKNEFRNSDDIIFVGTEGNFDPFNVGNNVNVRYGGQQNLDGSVLDAIRADMLKKRLENLATNELPSESHSIISYKKS